MANKGKQKYLPFPIFGLCFYKDLVLISGGGGGKKFAIQNKLIIFKSQTMEQLKEIDTGDELLVSTQHSQDSDLIVGALAKDIVFYKLTGIDALGKSDKDASRLGVNVAGRTASEKVKNLSIVKLYDKDTKIITAGEEGFVGLWDADKGGKARLRLRFFVENDVFACDCNGKVACVALKNQGCGVYCAENGVKLKTLQFSNTPNTHFMLRHCALTDRDLYTLSTSKNASYLTRWDLKEDFAPVDSMKVAKTSAAVLKVSKSFKTAAVGISDGSISLINLNKFNIQSTQKQFDMPATCFDFNSKETALMVGSADYSYCYIKLTGYPWLWMLMLTGFVGFLSLFLA